MCRVSREALKVFVTDSPISFESLEMPPITDKHFLCENQDPASIIMSTSSPDAGYPKEEEEQLNMGSQTCSDIWKGSGSYEATGDKWCCFEARFVIHKVVDTMGRINSKA